jgi:hypothetical protein
MFTKEMYAVSIFDTSRSEGIPYLINSILFVVPSQIYPAKLSFSPTHVILTISMLGGGAYKQGIGTAGTMIGDGYRFLGTVGVFTWACVLGSAFGMTRRWLSSDVKPKIQGPVLLKIILLSGLYAWIYNIIRTDLSEMIYIFIYYLFIPWIFLSKFVLHTRPNIWIDPLKLSKS